MQLLSTIWNGIGGLGVGTVFLKALFIIFLAVIFWILCELVKHLINIVSRLAIDMLRYLAVVVRGWPADSEESARGWEAANRKSPDRTQR